MKMGETILFKMPKAEYRTGMIVDDCLSDDGVEMPVVVDYLDRSYPVHPDNIEDLGNEKWMSNEGL